MTAVRQSDESKDNRPLRFGMRRLMIFVTAFCLLLGSGAWILVGWPLAVLCVFVAMQLPLMLLVRRHLSK